MPILYYVCICIWMLILETHIATFMYVDLNVEYVCSSTSTIEQLTSALHSHLISRCTIHLTCATKLTRLQDAWKQVVDTEFSVLLCTEITEFVVDTAVESDH